MDHTLGDRRHRGRIDEFIGKALYNLDLPGLAIGVSVGAGSPAPSAGTRHEAAAGYLDMPEGIPLRTDSIFHMASVSKLFVSTGILMLMERGLLDLDAPVAGYLPWMRMDDPRFARVTARQLLSHTAGMPDVEDYAWDAPEFDRGALKRYLCSPEVVGARLLWEPGDGRFRYSNMGYELLGALASELSGLDFESFMEDGLMRPADMASSTFLTFRRGLGRRPHGSGPPGEREAALGLGLAALREAGVCSPHFKDADRLIARERRFPYNRAHAPSSTLTSSLGDMLIWGDAHLRRGLLRPETYAEAWAARALVPNNGEGIGLGWFIREQGGHRLYGHEGTDDGFRASFWICPDLDLQIAVMSNLSEAPVKKINRQVFDILTS
ncbi:MAG: beta-lactamase family protein [Clostridiales Family XIII bacterium]|jgi:CubicO group peptidase (beta-lactamase class C family)|nr:beta-lactamase family protein [Clostridiales Family XIII bacterium]